VEEVSTLTVGAVFAGRYRIVELLGQGGTGSVFVAEDAVSGVQVALKVLRADTQLPGDIRRRFEREAQTIAQLDHPHLVRLEQFGFDEDGHPFMALELVRGGTLGHAIVDDGSMPEAEATRLAGQIAGALHAAHRLDIVHRDLKPTNVIIGTAATGERYAKVVDFGLAKLLGPEVTALTRPGRLLGTPHYVSPEQAIGARVDERSDLYSLGCVLHAMLAGEPPYDGAKMAELLERHVRSPIPPLPDRLVDGRPPSQGLIDLHQTLLAKAATARPMTAAVVEKICAALSAGEQVHVARELEAARNQAFGEPEHERTVATIRSHDSLADTAEPVIEPATTAITPTMVRDAAPLRADTLPPNPTTAIDVAPSRRDPPPLRAETLPPANSGIVDPALASRTDLLSPSSRTSDTRIDRPPEEATTTTPFQHPSRPPPSRAQPSRPPPPVEPPTLPTAPSLEMEVAKKLPPKRSSALSVVTALFAAVALLSVGYMLGRPAEQLASSVAQPAPPPKAPAPAPVEARAPVAVSPTPEAVRVDSVPTAATVLIDGQAIGTTPLDVPRSDAAQVLSIVLEGYEARTLTLTPDAPDASTVRLKQLPAPEPEPEPAKPVRKRKKKKKLPVW